MFGLDFCLSTVNHSPRNERVEVQLVREGEWQIVRVSDRGLGITDAELLHLFERFYQGQSDRVSTGSGLGLYLSRQIIEAHGGKIWAENRASQGAIFSFRLPAISE